MRTSASGPEGHGAQFYDDLPFLALRVGSFLAEGLRAGGAAIAVARPAHLAAIGAVLVDLGFDPTELANTGRLVLLDADTTLSALSTDGDPDRAKFRTLIGGVLDTLRAKSNGAVRVYGEMVDILWGAGRAEAMIALEAMWNDLGRELPFELLCGYRMGAFADGQHIHTFQRVCAAHTHVMPTEQLAEVSSAKLVELEQRARALEAELVKRRAAEEQLSQALAVADAARLEAEEATRAREEILSVVSHDLRNPLGTIMMGASTLVQTLDTSDPKLARIHTVAQRIHRQSERMARLIDDLVDFAGIQNGQLEIARTAHEPASIIAQTNELFGPLATERGLEFQAATDGTLPPIACDAQRAVQILASLVTNALKVTPRGGSISIGVRPVEDDVVFYVRDTGPGIAPDELPSLFERYWRSKQPQYKGAGLGLSIARGLVEAHGGRIWAESQPGTGSTFFFSLTQNRN